MPRKKVIDPKVLVHGEPAIAEGDDATRNLVVAACNFVVPDPEEEARKYEGRAGSLPAGGRDV